MTTVPSQTLIDALNWRYATKKFDAARKIPAATWKALEESLVLTPSSYGLQPWKFLVIDDAATRAKLSAAAWGQTQPVDASHFVVFAGRVGYSNQDLEHFIQHTAAVRKVAPESLAGYRKVIQGSIDGARTSGSLDGWMAKQSYIALGQFMASCALLGVDTCPMEGLDPAKFDEILGLAAKGYHTLCACAAGYRAADDKYATTPKVRFPASEVLSHV
jgi:nitroreductase